MQTHLETKINKFKVYYERFKSTNNEWLPQGDL